MNTGQPSTYTTDGAHTLLTPAQEHILLEEVAAGSLQAYTKLYTLYLPLVHQYIAKFLDFQRADIEEVAQDVFFKIWKKREALVAVRSFEKFIYIVARNTVTDFYRSRKLRTAKELGIAREWIPPAYPADEKVITGEYYTLAKQALDLLPEKRRHIFELRTQQELSLEQIAAETGMSVAGVHKNLYQAVTFIRSHLKGHGLQIDAVLIIYILLS